MADEKLDEDLDLGIESQGGSKKKLIIIGAAAGLLLLLLGAGVAWFFMGGDENTPEGGDAEEVVEEEKLPAVYHPLDPVFVVNMPPGGNAKMLQVGVQIMTRIPEVVDFVKHNDPMVRHTLLSLFGSQDDARLRDRKGKEELQEEVLSALNKIVKDQEGPGEIEAVYFTAFVMQ
jgi:flagellar FliL protein